ncbi:recombinase XerD [Xenorhabdus indica]|nr:recombinase XerD [Xenorhabdus indica]
MKAPDRNLQLVRCLLGHRSLATTLEYIDIDMEIAGKTLENELAIYLDISV